MKKWWARTREIVVHKILGLDDTPHRIAWGVFLGTVIVFTPTLGFQIAIYVAVAALLRANKASGIPILFVSNVFTAVPLYYSVWWIGDYILHGGRAETPEVRASIEATLEAKQMRFNQIDWTTDLFQSDFWIALWEALLDAGAELWVGAGVLGITFGVPLYFLTIRGVRTFRNLRAYRQSRIEIERISKAPGDGDA